MIFNTFYINYNQNYLKIKFLKKLNTKISIKILKIIISKLHMNKFLFFNE